MTLRRESSLKIFSARNDSGQSFLPVRHFIDDVLHVALFSRLACFHDFPFLRGGEFTPGPFQFQMLVMK
jgi:hypothetical protein